MERSRSDLSWAPEDDPAVGADELEAALRSVVGAGRTRKVRRRAVGGALALVVAVLGAAGVFAMGDDDSGRQVRFADTPTTEAPGVTPTLVNPGLAPSTTDTTARPTTPLPDEVFISRPYGNFEGTEIVLVDPRTKRDKRVIYRTTAGVTNMSVTPDRKWVYFEAATCGTDVQRVRVDGPAEGKTSERVSDVPSSDPEVSPDGTKVAYIGTEECGVDSGVIEYQIHVRDVEGSGDRVVARTTEGILSSPTWSPDGTAIAVAVTTYGDEQPPDMTRPLKESYVGVFSAVGTDQDLSKGRKVLSQRKGWGLGTPQYLADGTLFVTDIPLAGSSGPVTMSVVDGLTGRRLRLVATGDVNRRYFGLQADRSGNHLLYLSAPDSGPTDLRLSSNGQKTVVLATNVEAAAW